MGIPVADVAAAYIGVFHRIRRLNHRAGGKT